MPDTLPRAFGDYVLTAALGEDALGREYRALPSSGEPGFLRLRILDSPELSADALIDAIESNGEVHSFLKNPAVARAVHMDAAEGIPYLVWSEPNGRTLAALLAKCRTPPRKIPVEHALLIVEKVATALDHAYNTTIDGDRTLHGLVWPGFIGISDDGEIRLSGFGLAPGVLGSLSRPRLAREIAPYLAPEEKAQARVGRNSDVYSVGVILLELLTGQPPASTDPLAVLRGSSESPPVPLLPELQAVLRLTLGPEETRYASPGDLRRELGKLLFSGPYSPSTFNLAYFLNDLFRDEIEAETRARNREAAGGRAAASTGDAGKGRPASVPAAPLAAPAPQRPPSVPTFAAQAPAPRRNALAWVAGLIGAAVLAAVVLLSRRGRATAEPRTGPARHPPSPTATFLPEFVATPEGPTNAMTEAQFQDEVSRRLGVEVQKLKKQMESRAASAPAPAKDSPAVPGAEPTSSPPVVEAAPAASVAEEPPPVTFAPPGAPTARAEAEPPPTVAPAPVRPVIREGSLVPIEEVDSPPRLVKIVKPTYPPLALRAHIGGIVVLRILVSERGTPLQVEVVRDAKAGLTEAAVDAAQKWTFQPATKAGVAVRTWMVVPIPFEP